MKKLLIVCFIILTACASLVQHTLIEDYDARMPRSVAVIPAMGEGNLKVREIIRADVEKKLSAMNYDVLRFEITDEVSLNTGNADFIEKMPQADAILRINVKEWEERLITPYASLKFTVEFTLYARDGKTLWMGSFSKKESDIRMDEGVLTLGIIEAYETRLERMIDMVFMTLPETAPKKEVEKRFFDWL